MYKTGPITQLSGNNRVLETTYDHETIHYQNDYNKEI